MVKKVTILEGSKIRRVGTSDTFISNKTITAELVQFKCGEVFYKIKETFYATSQFNTKERANA